VLMGTCGGELWNWELGNLGAGEGKFREPSILIYGGGFAALGFGFRVEDRRLLLGLGLRPLGRFFLFGIRCKLVRLLLLRRG